MQTLILKSDNTNALEAIKTLVKVLDIESVMKKNDDDSSFKIIKGVKVIKAKRKFNPQEMAGSLTDLNLENASFFKKKSMDKKESVLIDSDVLINFFDKPKKVHLKAENNFIKIIL